MGKQSESIDPGEGWRIASGDDWKDTRCEMWIGTWSERRFPSTPFDMGLTYRIPIEPATPFTDEMLAKAPKPFYRCGMEELSYPATELVWSDEAGQWICEHCAEYMGLRRSRFTLADCLERAKR